MAGNPIRDGHYTLVWTKVLAPIMAILHQKGIYIAPYVDDLIVKGTTCTKLKDTIQVVIKLLLQAGFVLNLEKSDLEPTQDLLYIGGRFLTKSGLVTLPQDRVQSLLNALGPFQTKKVVTALQFQHLLGLMASVLEVVPWARFYMRLIQIYLKQSWCQLSQPQSHPIIINQSLRLSLQWWEDIKIC